MSSGLPSQPFNFGQLDFGRPPAKSVYAPAVLAGVSGLSVASNIARQRDFETRVEKLRKLLDELHKESSEEALLLSQRSKWADLAPLIVADGGDVVAVQYSAAHLEAIGYFHAVLERGEKSERALELTADMIGHNQANYTAWQYRWQCLQALGTNLEDEYVFTEQIMADNAKNYQLWNHRRKIAATLGPGPQALSRFINRTRQEYLAVAQREMAFAAEALVLDEKNYHAWAHRQAIVQLFHLWDQELEYVDQMIGRDVRNNSAWNQRHFLLRHAATVAPAGPLSVVTTGSGTQDLASGLVTSSTSTADAPAAAAAPPCAEAQPSLEAGHGLTVPSDILSALFANAAAAAPATASQAPASAAPDPEPFSKTIAHNGWSALFERELEYIASKVQLAPRNESVWNYLMGLFTLPGTPPNALAFEPRVWTICIGALEDCPGCPAALDVLALYYLHIAADRTAHKQKDATPGVAAGGVELEVAAERTQALLAAERLLQMLMVSDPARTLYWAQRRGELMQLTPGGDSLLSG